MLSKAVKVEHGNVKKGWKKFVRKKCIYFLQDWYRICTYTYVDTCTHILMKSGGGS